MLLFFFFSRLSRAFKIKKKRKKKNDIHAEDFAFDRSPQIYLLTEFSRSFQAHNRLVADLDENKLEVVETQSFANEVSSALSKLKEKDVRIILGNFNESWARDIFCQAYK